jgi:GAG-pre-integrase domain
MDADLQEKGSSVVTDESLQAATKNNSAELLSYHYKFGHVSFARLQAMAKLGILPAKLAKCALPVCALCFYGKATLRATATKIPVSILSQKKVTQPGQVVSVDCLMSGDLGLIVQMNGGLTSTRYLHVCVLSITIRI